MHNLRSFQRDLLASADKMPESEYGFRPTTDVRPFGQVVAHAALSQFEGCAALSGEPNPKAGEREDAARTKTEHLALLKASSEYCDRMFGDVTDAWLHESVTLRGNHCGGSCSPAPASTPARCTAPYRCTCA